MAEIILSYQETSGTPGASASNPTWKTIPFNNENVDTGGDCTLLGDGSFTLAAGVYRLRAAVQLSGGAVTSVLNGWNGRLQNLTAGTTVTTVLGTTTRVIGSSSVSVRRIAQMEFLGRFTSTGGTYALQALIAGAGTSGNIGLPSANGVNEVYAVLELIKE